MFLQHRRKKWAKESKVDEEENDLDEMKLDGPKQGNVSATRLIVCMQPATQHQHLAMHITTNI